MTVILGRRKKMRFEGDGIVAYQLAERIGHSPRPYDTAFFTELYGHSGVIASRLEPRQKELLKVLLRLWCSHVTGVAAFADEVVVRFPNDEVAFSNCVYLGTTILENLGVAYRANSLATVGRYWSVAYTVHTALPYHGRSELLARHMDGVFSRKLATTS